MARIIGGSMIGELSGKLGGNVFARNKAGAYIRQYVIPTDPNSIAQANARISFGAASSSYHGLSDLAKANWDSFASNYYLPKNGINTGQFSGFNAFTALGTTAINAQKVAIDAGGVKYVGPDIFAISTSPFLLSAIAPSKTIQANIQSSNGDNYSLNLIDASIAENGAFTARLNLQGGTVPGGINLPDELNDGNNNKIGFTFYISNPVQQSHMFISNPELIQIASVGVPKVATGLAIGVEALEITGQSILPDKYKSFPVAGEFVRFTIYSTSESGQTIRIGSKTVMVDPT